MSLPVLRCIQAHIAHATALASVTMLMAAPAHASGSSMPWEEPLQQILESIEGPVAKIIAVIVIISTGLALAFGDASGGFIPKVMMIDRHVPTPAFRWM